MLRSRQGEHVHANNGKNCDPLLKRHHHYLCFQFAIILLTLLIVQVAIGAYAFLQVGDTQDLKSSFKQIVERKFNEYNTTKIDQEEFDFLQSFVSTTGTTLQ